MQGMQSKWASKICVALHQKMKSNGSRVRDILSKFDTDGSGALDSLEFQGALVELGIPAQLEIPDDELGMILQEVFQSFDADDSGIIDFKELNAMLRAGKFYDVDLEDALKPGDGIDAAHHALQNRLEQESTELDRFSDIDLDGSGQISMRELHAFLTAEGNDTKFVEQLMATLDADASGTIDKAEWEAGCTLLRGSSLLNAMTNPVQPHNKDAFSDLFVAREIWAGGAGEHYHHDRRNHVVSLKEETILGKRSKGCSIPAVENRGIIVSQLRSFTMHIQRRCEKEGWVNSFGRRLTPDQVTQYDSVAYVTKPSTRERKCSYVELVSPKEHAPAWFVSHAWSDSVLDCFACLEQHARDRSLDMTSSAYWISAFALSPWILGTEAINGRVTQSAFRRAMAQCSGTLCVVGNSARSVRSWVCFEIYHSILSSRSTNYLFDVYTAKSHNLMGELVHIPKEPLHFMPGRGKWDKNVIVHEVSEPRLAVGLTDGLCQKDFDSAQYKALRESHFPIDRLERLMGACVEHSEATVDSDRVSILNVISGDRGDLTGPPPKTHPAYDEFNGILRGGIATMCLMRCIDEGGQFFETALEALIHSQLASLHIDLSSRKSLGRGTMVSRLVEFLPTTLESLTLLLPPNLTELPVGKLRKLTKLRMLDLKADGLIQLPEDIEELISLETLELRGLKKIIELPDQLLELRELNSINCQGCCGLRRISAKAPKMRSNVAQLNLEGCESLDYLQDELRLPLGNLQVLSLKGCTQLPHLPTWISELEKRGMQLTLPDHLKP